MQTPAGTESRRQFARSYASEQLRRHAERAREFVERARRVDDRGEYRPDEAEKRLIQLILRSRPALRPRIDHCLREAASGVLRPESPTFIDLLIEHRVISAAAVDQFRAAWRRRRRRSEDPQPDSSSRQGRARTPATAATPATPARPATAAKPASDGGEDRILVEPDDASAEATPPTPPAQPSERLDGSGKQGQQQQGEEQQVGPDAADPRVATFRGNVNRAYLTLAVKAGALPPDDAKAALARLPADGAELKVHEPLLRSGALDPGEHRRVLAALRKYARSIGAAQPAGAGG